MQIIGADFVVLCDAEFRILKQGGICFNTQEILAVDSYQNLCEQYQGIPAQYFESCAITPALANLHLHLEFSQNEGLLHFGEFGKWLDSVIENREVLMQEKLTGVSLKTAMQQGIQECLQSGVGFVGAVSSYGYDLNVLADSPLRVLYFNEVIGSKVESLDILFQNFLMRLEDSKSIPSRNLIPAIAIHSPYSVHSKLLEKVLQIATKEKLPLSVHFLESFEEKEWLESGKGYFQEFFKKFFGNKVTPFYTMQSFLEFFKDIQNTYFVHCLEADSSVLEKIAKLQGKIITCPKSNRLLNSKFLNISALKKYGIPFCLGTDGKSSNNTLCLLDELRIALFAYPSETLESLARELLLSVTRNAFLNTPFKLGTLQVGNLADFALFKIPKTKEFLAQNLILYAKEAMALYINGVEVLKRDAKVSNF
ncbi:aminofutalosine deaminase family hydrolase [uncultured Helicobacter sp.]|uniref:aminofutalosine deaminase family hydrolase n=1 Tax=uncultured Helicobacter sp. TaxID=175537 RepID=UPI0026263B2F|nr:aminofutalosine deaminase family hydrolase [uncultured Helicobacter sp.]